jgi:histidine phosphatase superfamily protein (branch 1)
MSRQRWLVRQGETEWAASGQHTGRTDLRLKVEGKLHVRQIAGFLRAPVRYRPNQPPAASEGNLTGSRGTAKVPSLMPSNAGGRDSFPYFHLLQRCVMAS